MNESGTCWRQTDLNIPKQQMNECPLYSMHDYWLFQASEYQQVF